MVQLNIDSIKAACARKKLYKTREAVEAARMHSLEKYGKVLRVYYCKLNCQGWHLTSKKFNRFQEVRIVW